jgi:hypothetical protein
VTSAHAPAENEPDPEFVNETLPVGDCFGPLLVVSETVTVHVLANETPTGLGTHATLVDVARMTVNVADVEVVPSEPTTVFAPKAAAAGTVMVQFVKLPPLFVVHELETAAPPNVNEIALLPPKPPPSMLTLLPRTPLEGVNVMLSGASVNVVVTLPETAPVALTV